MPAVGIAYGDRAVTEVAKRIKNALVSEISECRVYKYTCMGQVSDEYIVVNHLPFVYKNDIGEGVININYHLSVDKVGVPNTARLSQGARFIAQLFPEGTYLNGAYYEFYSESRPTEDDDNTYYINIQIKVIFNTLKE